MTDEKFSTIVRAMNELYENSWRISPLRGTIISYNVNGVKVHVEKLTNNLVERYPETFVRALEATGCTYFVPGFLVADKSLGLNVGGLLGFKNLAQFCLEVEPAVSNKVFNYTQFLSMVNQRALKGNIQKLESEKSAILDRIVLIDYELSL